MAIHQQAGSKTFLHRADQPRERVMIGLPACGDAVLRLGEAQPVAIDGGAGGNHARQRAEARGHARAAGVDPVRQRVLEHARIKFPGFTVDVAPGAREFGCNQHAPMGGGGGKYLINKTILAAAQGERIKA
jgi:hypothetical protein